MGNRKITDAHMHIRPARLCGKVDEPLKVTLNPFGRAVQEDGTVYQIMPPYFADSAFETDALLATMDRFGVEKGILMQSYAFEMNEEIAQAVAAHPGRIAGAMVVDPREPDAAERMRYWKGRGLGVIKFEMSNILGFTHKYAYPDFRFDGDDVMVLLREAEKLGVTVVIDPNAPGSAGYQVEAIEKVLTALPDLKVVICHLGFMTLGGLQDEKAVARWKQMLSLARHENVWFDVSALPDLFLDEAYPFPTAMRLVKEFIAEYGEKKAIWGSDLPGTFNSATYRQMLDMFERDPELSETAKDRLFYGNAEDAYFG